jgi:hypothetical protein
MCSPIGLGITSFSKIYTSQRMGQFLCYLVVIDSPSSPTDCIAEETPRTGASYREGEHKELRTQAVARQ